ncbi:MAG: hypothetical protein L0Y79_10855 [Chlorobi bacterium]|nr:hypothetical protein [Chlorobiota bacterium]MCI0715555.1 hypothetical protein [Chlorobiota bacterium]
MDSLEDTASFAAGLIWTTPLLTMERGFFSCKLLKHDLPKNYMYIQISSPVLEAGDKVVNSLISYLN